MILAGGLSILAIIPWSSPDASLLVGGFLVTAAGLFLTLLAGFAVVYGTIAGWRDWRQLRSPAVVIDAAGVHYQAARPALVPWPDVEQVCLKRTILRQRVICNVSLRLRPGAALIREGRVTIPASRRLGVGLLSDTGTPEELAVRFLLKASGNPLNLEEREPFRAHPGYRSPTFRRQIKSVDRIWDVTGPASQSPAWRYHYR